MPATHAPEPRGSTLDPAWSALVSEWTCARPAVAAGDRRERAERPATSREQRSTLRSRPVLTALRFRDRLPKALPPAPCAAAIAALPKQRALVGALLSHTGYRHADCRVGQARLAELTDSCERTIRRAVAILRSIDVILVVEHGPRDTGSARYAKADHYLLHPELVIAYWSHVFSSRTRAERPVTPPAAVEKMSGKPETRLPSGAGRQFSQHNTFVSSSREVRRNDKESGAGGALEVLTSPSVGMRAWIARDYVRRLGDARCLQAVAWMRSVPNYTAIRDRGAFLHAALRDGYVGIDITARSRRSTSSRREPAARRNYAVGMAREREHEQLKADSRPAARESLAAIATAITPAPPRRNRRVVAQAPNVAKRAIRELNSCTTIQASLSSMFYYLANQAGATAAAYCVARRGRKGTAK